MNVSDLKISIGKGGECLTLELLPIQIALTRVNLEEMLKLLNDEAEKKTAYIRCYFCKTVTKESEAKNKAWIASFWDEISNHEIMEAVCPTCLHENLKFVPHTRHWSFSKP